MSKFPVNKMKRVIKKKGFFIDKITEDSFYENLLLGLTTFLKTCSFVTHQKLERFPPVSFDDVYQWQNANGLYLPEDLRDFFLSTNGFSFTYRFHYNKTESEDVNYVVTGIEVNPLLLMEKIVTPDTMYQTERGMQILAPYSKIHILSKVDENSCVVLVQFNPLQPSTFWLFYKMRYLYFLCLDFVTYFRMALAHLGVPGWPLSVLKGNFPEWSSEMIQILAPGVFDRHLPDNTIQFNRLDCAIFNTSDDLEVICEPEKVSVCEKKKIPRSKPKK